MDTINLIIIAVTALVIIAIIAFVFIVLAVIKHQQKMLSEFQADDFNGALAKLSKGNHHG